jgi:hypothetical protein
MTQQHPLSSPLPPSQAADQQSHDISPEMEALLAKLHDIKAPPPVDWWPLAPGWWILAGLLLTSLILSFWWLKNRRRKKAYRRDAHSEMRQLATQDSDQWIRKINELLKRTALAAYSQDRALINGLYGEPWVSWLNNRCRQPVFIGETAVILGAGGYRREDLQIDEAIKYQIMDAAKKWISQHQHKKEKS